MPRIGMNPARGQTSDYRPPRVTVAVLTHIPHLSGYFEHHFEVTRLCLESLIANTTPPVDFLVFDNGSCPPVVDYLCRLRDEGQIQYLILSSRNIGKIGAFQIIFRAALGEIVAYTDDDVLFLPGWLEAHLKILDAFPKAGMVTGYYFRIHTSYGMQSTLDFAQRPEVQARRGRLIPREMEQHYVENTGRTWERYLEETRGLEDISLTYQGVEALASAGHYQFVAPKQVILDALPKDWSGYLMGKMRDLDQAVDQLGYLRLSVPRPVIRMLSNVVPAELAEEIRAMGLSAQGVKASQPARGALARFYALPPVRRLLTGLYNRLHQVIHSSNQA